MERTGRGCGLAAGLATVGTVFVAGVGPLSTAAGVVALAALVGSQLTDSGLLANLVGLALLAELVAAALAGATVTTVLAAGAGSVLAWTFAHSAIELRADLGEAPSLGAELSHTAGTTGLVTAVALLSAVVFRTSALRLSPLALAAVILGGVALTAALRR